MTPALERIADKARRESTLRFTSLAHHLTRERWWMALHHISPSTAPGTDGLPQPEAVDTFNTWAQPLLEAVHRQSLSSTRRPAGVDTKARKDGEAPLRGADGN